MNPNEELNEVWDNYYDSIFETYDSYCSYINEEWISGHINELEEGNLIVIDSIIEDPHKETQYRTLTEQEFNERFKN